MQVHIMYKLAQDLQWYLKVFVQCMIYGNQRLKGGHCWDFNNIEYFVGYFEFYVHLTAFVQLLIAINHCRVDKHFLVLLLYTILNNIQFLNFFNAALQHWILITNFKDKYINSAKSTTSYYSVAPSIRAPEPILNVTPTAYFPTYHDSDVKVN